jgi:hypothetical protein
LDPNAKVRQILDGKQGPDVAQDRNDIPDDSYDRYIGAELTLRKGHEVPYGLKLKEEIDKWLGAKASQEDFEKDDIELTNPDLYEDDDQAESFASDREDIPDNAYGSSTILGMYLMPSPTTSWTDMHSSVQAALLQSTAESI